MILISNDFWHKIKKYNFDPYYVLLSIATNIAVLLITAFVLQRHISKIIVDGSKFNIQARRMRFVDLILNTYRFEYLESYIDTAQNTTPDPTED